MLTGSSEEEVSATLETKVANKSVNTYTGITTVTTSQEEQKNISTLSKEDVLEVFKRDNLST
ncbi:hypothetical protein [Clostridium sp.]|uniref:hypothetical protein n=1 Tax=Clostridium sp. TaxID=1506 RepID=UPI003EEE9FB5